MIPPESYQNLSSEARIQSVSQKKFVPRDLEDEKSNRKFLKIWLTLYKSTCKKNRDVPKPKSDRCPDILARKGEFPEPKSGICQSQSSFCGRGAVFEVVDFFGHVLLYEVDQIFRNFGFLFSSSRSRGTNFLRWRCWFLSQTQSSRLQRRLQVWSL